MKFKEHIYFYPEKPFLIHRDQALVDEMSDDERYVAEPKYNGTRCVMTILDHAVSFWTRHGHPVKTLNHSAPEYQELVNEVKQRIPAKGHFQFDSELRHHKVIGLSFHIVVWDCFIYNDEFLNKLVYDERRPYVEKHFGLPKTKGKVVSLSEFKRRIKVIEQFPGHFRQIYGDFMTGKRNLGHEDEFEGLVIKDRQGKLALGRTTNPESRWMYKIRRETGRHKF